MTSANAKTGEDGEGQQQSPNACVATLVVTLPILPRATRAMDHNAPRPRRSCRFSRQAAS